MTGRLFLRAAKALVRVTLSDTTSIMVIVSGFACQRRRERISALRQKFRFCRKLSVLFAENFGFTRFTVHGRYLMHQVPHQNRNFRQKISARCRVPGSRYLPCIVKRVKPKFPANKTEIFGKTEFFGEKR